MNDPILLRTADAFNVSIADLISGSREWHLVDARAAAAWALLHQGRSLSSISTTLGRRKDRTVVHHMLARGNALAGDPRWLRKLRKVTQI